MSRAIGMFDSGVGGISVLRDAVRMLPHERFIFYGDNQNAPYGVKTQCEILNCTQRAIQTLLERNVKALVLACNTATAAAAKELRAKLDIPVIGMEPALKPAHFLRHGGQILVLATPATLHMEKFRHLMEQYGEGAVPVEGYGLVECIESGHVAPDDPQLISVLHKLLDPHLDVKTDAVVLRMRALCLCKRSAAAHCAGRCAGGRQRRHGAPADPAAGGKRRAGSGR